LDKSIKIVRISREIELIRRNRKLERRISFIGSNEKSHYYILRKSSADSSPHEDFICDFFIEQMKIIINNKCISYRESSARSLKIQSLVEKYVGKNLSIIEDNPNFTTFHDILDKNCSDNDRDIDLALTNVNFNENYEVYTKANLQIAVNKFMKSHTPNNILHDYVLGFCQTYEDFFVFRKEFTYNYSTAMYFSYILGNSKFIDLY